MSRRVVVVQARMGSSRLPGKVLLPLAGEPLLVRMLERVLAARATFDLLVATTIDPADDPLVDLCERHGFPVMRGHPTDLLDRHFQAALLARAHVVVKIPSDCPLIDPGVIDRVLEAFDAAPCDYASNLHPPTYPDGNDVEVMSIAALETAWLRAKSPHQREHTTPFLWEDPARFRTVNVAWETGRDWSDSHRFTIDYAEDYALISAVYDALWTPSRPSFSLSQILALLDARPELRTLNARHHGVTWHRRHLAERALLDERNTTEAAQ